MSAKLSRQLRKMESSVAVNYATRPGQPRTLYMQMQEGNQGVGVSAQCDVRVSRS